MSETGYDIFLSYNSQDRAGAQDLYKKLRSRGLHPWLDVEDAPPGEPWLPWLEKMIQEVATALVLIGPSGVSESWEMREITTLLDQQGQRDLLVIPILLPGARADEVSSFLKTVTFVDLREDPAGERLDRLVSRLRGTKPALPEPSRGPAREPRPSSRALLQNLPFISQRELFRGRLRELERMAAELTAGDQTLVLYGLGGIGKTRLAVEYAWRYGDRYSAAFFLVAESPERLRSQIAALSRLDLLDLPQSEGQSEDVVQALVLRRLREQAGWLLILDDADSLEAVDAIVLLLPRLSGGHVLITSRIDDYWPPELSRLSMETISPDDAASFLLARTAPRRRPLPEDGTLALRLAESLGCLPLALEQAAAYIGHLRMTLAEYAKGWETESDRAPREPGRLVAGYSRPLEVTFQHTLRQLEPTAIAVLRLASYLAPEPIPIALFEQGATILKEATEQVAAEMGGPPSAPLPVRAAIANLATYSMIQRDDRDLLSVHRMVQKVMRTSVPEARRETWIELTLRIAQAALPPAPDDARNWPAWDPLRPHIAQIIGRADAVGLGHKAARSMNQLATLLYAKGLFAEAEPLMRRVLAVSESSLGPDHPDVAILLNNLGALLRETHRPAEAEPLLHRALAIDEREFGDSSSRVARDLNNLAASLKDTGRLDEAETLLRRALAIHETTSGPSHPEIARILNNLSQLLQDTRRLQEAEPLVRRALEIDETCFGRVHPNVARDLNSLARLLQDAQQREEAERLMRRALEIHEKWFGPNHPKVAHDLSNLAQLLQDAGQREEAEGLMRRALEIDESFFGPESLIVAQDLNNLALVVQIREEAVSLMRRSLGIHERRLGESDPETRRIRQNLECLQGESGE